MSASSVVPGAVLVIRLAELNNLVLLPREKANRKQISKQKKSSRAPNPNAFFVDFECRGCAVAAGSGGSECFVDNESRQLRPELLASDR